MKRRNEAEHEEKPRNGMVFLLLLMLAGTLAGSVLQVLYPEWQLWQNAVFRQGMGIFTPALGNVLIHGICVPLLWLAAVAMVGLSLAGAPVAIGLFVLRGAALGGILGSLYTQMGIKGLLVSALFVMPYAFLSMLVFVLAVREALRFSLQIGNVVFCCDRENELPLKLYGIRFLVLSGMLVVFGLLQCCCLQYGYPAFLKYMMGE